MRPNYSISDLNIDIKLLELRQKQELQDLKDQIQLTKESLKPANLFKKALANFKIDTTESRGILNTILSIGTGYLSSKLVVGKSKSTFKQFLGSMLEITIANFIAKKTSS